MVAFDNRDVIRIFFKLTDLIKKAFWVISLIDLLTYFRWLWHMTKFIINVI